MYSRTPPNHICDHFPKYSRYSPTPSRNYSRSCNCKESSTSMASHFSRIKEKAARVLRSPDKKKEFPKPDVEDGKSPPKSPEDEVPKEKEKKRDHRSKFPPSKEQMERWTSSISCLLKDPDGVEAFREFLKELEDESGEENEHTKYIDFYIECEEYKIEFKRLEDRAKTIYEEYLAIGADKEVGTGGKGVDIGDKLEEDGLEGVSLFDEPLTKVIHKLETGYYVNFCLRLKEKLKL
ncbi:regulator of G-protein signaling rgs-2-like isoform X6 [Palaemon carinicauda]|uniref:regulator of G-protein signaling rgs-2-like isoform X6 n=1 Tax=Palaemon carinicauda TaxID=392227 RepID=UPI0035B616A3